MKERKRFVEPEIVKCEESLDRVTLCHNRYRDDNDCYSDRPNWWNWFGWW
ncbi:MAG: hypothetical protein AB1390_05020 [Nitrospirota bacterium]